MFRFAFFCVGCLILFAGCQTRESRIRQQSDLFLSLDQGTQEKVRRGEIEVGYTSAMVELALGTPTETATTPDGSAVWIYRNFHRDPKDQIRGGYRRQVVFDPVLRAETVIVKPIDDRLAARLAPQSLRLTFRDGRVVALENIPEI